MIMDFPMAFIFLMLSAVTVLVHTNSQCTTTPSCNHHLNNVEILEQLVDIKIRAALANMPVIRMLGFEVDDFRIAKIRAYDFKTPISSRILDQVNISDPSQSVTGDKNIVAYRPWYQDTTATEFGHGGSNTTAVFFINMREAFPCIKNLSYHYHPVCKIFTNEEDGFRSYRSIIEAADSGNHFRIFSTTWDIPTYGFGIQGCAEFTINCLPTHHSLVIICYSPC